MLFTDMIAGVLARARGCPRETATNAMRNACMEWCRNTYCLTEGVRVTVDGIDVPSLDMDQVVYDILDAWVGSTPVRITHMNDPEVERLDVDEYALTYADPANIQLTPPGTVEVPVTLDMLVAFGPGPEATEVSALLWQRYSEWLTSGALYRVLEEPGNSWTNEKSAAYHKTRYEDAMTSEAAFLGRNRVNNGQILRAAQV